MSDRDRRDFREAAQQDHDSAVEALRLEQEYERYDGPLNWSQWLAARG